MTGELRNRKSSKTSGNSSKTSKSNYVPAKFINRELTKDETAACKAKPFSPQDYVDALDRILEDEYKVTTSYDDYHNCFVCALVPIGGEHTHSGYILSGRGSSALKAFKQTLYIHYELFDAVWPSSTVKQELEIDD